MKRKHCFSVSTRVDIELAFELFDKVVGQSLTPVQTAKHHVSVRGKHTEARRCVSHNSHVERTTSKVIHQNGTLIGLQISPSQLTTAPGVCQSCRSRLVNNINHIQASDAPCVLSCLATHVVEVVRHCDDCIRDRPDNFLGVLLHLLQNQCRYEFRSQLLVLIDHKEILVAHFTLDRFHDRLGIGNRDTLKRWPDHDAVFVQQHHRWRNRTTICVVQHDGVAVMIQHRDCAVGCAQVDADRMSFKKLHCSPRTLQNVKTKRSPILVQIFLCLRLANIARTAKPPFISALSPPRIPLLSTERIRQRTGILSTGRFRFKCRDVLNMS